MFNMSFRDSDASPSQTGQTRCCALSVQLQSVNINVLAKLSPLQHHKMTTPTWRYDMALRGVGYPRSILDIPDFV